ncbi:hypothetical protein [Segetibacter sp.]|jgi:hypothetical protein|uniref:hypothetical protein n=1 Tax=Segetibacter sp. TaxID=2231182 RepID=UPI0026276715|nr:hypothetical protein [Segetibacter sp.]MCW3080802.1 hypothetical protein [Segetibacter sp.]
MKTPLLNHLKNQFSEQLPYEGFELPETIRQCVEETIAANVATCLDPLKAKGHCLRMSDLLMLNLAEAGKKPFVDCKIIHTKKPHPHFWLYVDGWHIDLTAKQFNPDAPCPKIWKDEDCNLSSLYAVERGKGTVLFKLVPFKEKSVPAYSTAVISRIWKRTLKKHYNDLKNTVIDFISNRVKQENSILG